MFGGYARFTSSTLLVAGRPHCCVRSHWRTCPVDLSICCTSYDASVEGLGGPRVQSAALIAVTGSFAWFSADRIRLGSPNRGSRRFARHEALGVRSEEHTSELQSRENLVCRL